MSTEEQETISTLYARLDQMREQAQRRLAEALARPVGGTHQARSERDSAVTMYADQIRQWDAAEHGLCFGRLDYERGGLAGGEVSSEHRHIGRLGLFDPDDDYEPLLVDWRAPAARPFYLATAANPEGVRRRRHIRTKLREVVSIEDEVLDLSAAQDTNHPGLTSEAALMSALTATRTGRMRDIVETIQAEQDSIIRSDLRGILVVQGGPGTGKTAVALHRAAYLLYTHREALSRQGVLILGPNETFLRYISQVLPGLGETSVLLSTVSGLYPGVAAHRREPAEVAKAKGGLEMVKILEDAVAGLQRVPDEAFELTTSDSHAGFGYERQVLSLEPSVVLRARERARRSGRPHNLARPIFVESIIRDLARQTAERIGDDPYKDDPLGGDDAPGTMLLDDSDVAVIRRELSEDQELNRALDALWPRISPQRFLSELFATTDIGWLRRPAGGGWSPADVPLLDEAAELLGEEDSEREALRERLRRQRIAYAEGVLTIASGSGSTDFDVEDEAEMLTALDIVSAAELAERHEETELLTAAQRAAVDRRWAFGHIIVDEAQELSPMAWRLLMRRAPSRSLTVVGDVAQTGDLAGAGAWAEIFEPYVGERWRLTELSVNYRTPAEIMAEAAAVLARISPDLKPPRSVRETGVKPWTQTVAPQDLDDALRQRIEQEKGMLDGGRLGVIVPETGGGEPDLEATVSVLTVKQAKGLEFDSVIVVDPERIVAASPRGLNDLYVALTRATQRLGILTPKQN